MTKQNIVVQGTTVNSTVIGAYTKRLNNLESVVSVWANAAALQVAKHNNANWLQGLFNAAPMRIKNGELSALGKQVFKYIEAHFPRIVWDKESQKVGVKKYNAESPLATCFVAVGADAESEGIRLMGSKFYSEHGDFRLTFAEFQNLPKPEPKEGEETAPSVTAKAFVKQADKALECFKAKRFVGTDDELLSASLRAKELYLAIEAQLAEQAKAKETVDTAMVAQLLKSGQEGKSKRAGGKVEKAVA